MQGMSRPEVERLCGKPDHVNYSGLLPAIEEQWVYPEGFPSVKSTYLYFRSDKLSDAQWR